MLMETSVDPDQLASSRASWSGSTPFSKEGIEFWEKLCAQWVYYGNYQMHKVRL